MRDLSLFIHLMQLLFSITHNATTTVTDSRVQFEWQTSGNYIATTSDAGKLHVLDRHGDAVAEVAISG